MPRITLERARAAKKAALERFRNDASVTGIGITRVGGEYAVKVNLREPSAAALPETIDGVPVRVEVTGSIRPR
jgi:hypothetical protein